MPTICIFNRFSLMPAPEQYPLGDELKKLAAVQRCDLQHVRIGESGTILYKEVPLEADLFLWRVIEEYWQSAFHILSAGEDLGIKAINSSKTIASCADKAQANKLLQANNIPVAPASIIPRGSWAFPENGLIIKPLDEGGGRGVRMLKSPERVSAPCLQQDYLGEDSQFARVIFINQKILGFHKRKSLPGALANNFDLGGEIVAWEAPAEALEIAGAAHQASGAFFSAVDLVESETGWLVVEVNSTPGYRGLVELHGPDIHRQVAEEIANYV